MGEVTEQKDFKELRLTSPYMRGPNVRKAQKALEHNRFGHFYDGKITGAYSPMTAGATKEAKYKLGYPKRLVDQHYDYRLDSILNKRHDISPMMKHRRKLRTRQSETGVKERALAIGLKEVGTHESPANSNRVKYSEWYGLIGPWCAMFFTWCEVEGGSHIFEKGNRWASCAAFQYAAGSGYKGLRFTADPEKGDAVLYQFEGDQAPDHIGRFISWTNQARSSFRALEGNTSLTSNANGGEVQIRTRPRSEVTHFIRIPE